MQKVDKNFIEKTIDMPISGLWLLIKYQLLTKGIMTFLVFPIFNYALQLLLESSGTTALTSGNYTSYLLSVQGVLSLLLGFLLVVVAFAMDTSAFINISALCHEGYQATVRKVLLMSFKSFRLFLHPSSLLLILYVSIIVPFSGLGMSVSLFRNVQLPKFIGFVVEETPLYSLIYTLSIIAIVILSMFLIFTFHFVLLCRYSILKSIKWSFITFKRHYKNFIYNFFIKVFIKLALFLLAIFALSSFAFIPARFITENIDLSRGTLLLGFMIIASGLSILLFLVLPMQVNRLTKLFYDYCEQDGHKVIELNELYDLPKKRIISKFAKISAVTSVAVFVIMAVFFNFSIIVLGSFFFDDIFRNNKNIQVIAHRAGGNMAAENSLEGLKKAIEIKANWGEIDVQRTKDGFYIINHDSTFMRLAHVDLPSDQMTLQDIEALNIEDLFDKRRGTTKVATLEQMLDTAKDHIGLFVELKGVTADKKMADDVIKMIKAKNMENETVLLSLDYDLIQYIEKKYPEMKTGFLYFFAFGNSSDLVSDYLIMEETIATEDMVEQVQRNGKKAVVWTINTPDSIDKFVNSQVDGIITDFPKRVEKAIEHRKHESDFDIVMQSLVQMVTESSRGY